MTRPAPLVAPGKDRITIKASHRKRLRPLLCPPYCSAPDWRPKAWNKIFGRPGGNTIRRDTVFEVTKIEQKNNKNFVAVVLEEHRGARPPLVKGQSLAAKHSGAEAGGDHVAEV